MDTEKTRAQSSAQSLRLPQDIIEEILSRLPAKSLLRFRCVSKPWSSLIASKRFINIHLYNYTCKKTDNKWTRIIFHNEHGLNQYSNMGEQSLDITTDDPKIFDDPKNIHLMPGTIVDSCNGLLCIHKFPGCFFLWNPATRISIMLPEIRIRHLRIKKYGFGWDKHSGAYKVFVGMSNGNDTEKIGQVYSSKTDSWKKLEKVGNLSLRHISGRVAWGKMHVIHWVTESGDFETFDLESEKFEMLYLDAIRDEMEKLNMKSKKPGKTGVSRERQPGEAGVSRERQRCCKPFVYAESLVSPVDEIERVSVFTWASLFR